MIAEEKGNHLKELTDIVEREPDIGLLDTDEKPSQIMKGLAMTAWTKNI